MVVKRIMSPLLLLLALLVLLYAAIVIYVLIFQVHYIYLPRLPTRSYVATPADIGLSYEQVEVITDDGIVLVGWYIPASRLDIPSHHTVLFFHGNAGNISHRLESIRIFHQLGLSVFIIDYRGYGRSQGTPSEMGLRLDAQAAWRYLVSGRGLSPSRVIIFGRSLGASIAAYLAAHQQAAGLVLESAFVSIQEMMRVHYWFLPVRLILRMDHNTEAAIRDVKIPVLVIHSREDEVNPYAHGRRIYAAASQPKYFADIHGSHDTGFITSGQIYPSSLQRFVASLPLN